MYTFWSSGTSHVPHIATSSPLHSLTALRSTSQHLTGTSQHLTAPHSTSQHFTAPHSTSQHFTAAPQHLAAKRCSSMADRRRFTGNSSGRTHGYLSRPSVQSVPVRLVSRAMHAPSLAAHSSSPEGMDRAAHLIAHTALHSTTQHYTALTPPTARHNTSQNFTAPHDTARS